MASFFLLWGFLLMPVLLFLLIKIATPLGGAFLFRDETLTMILLIVPFLISVFKGVRRFYNLSKLNTVLFTLLFVSILMLFILTVYKVLLFFITTLVLH